MRTIVAISLLLAVAACDKNEGAAKPAPSAAAATPVGSSTISGASAKPLSEIAVTTSSPEALEAYKLGFDQFINGHVEIEV